MNLKKQYNNLKRKKSTEILSSLTTGLTSFGLIYILNLLWNYIAPTWGLPILTYTKFLSTLFLTHIFIHFLGFKATQRDVHPKIDFMKIIGEPPYEKQ